MSGLLQERASQLANGVGVDLACRAFGIRPRTYRYRQAKAAEAVAVSAATDDAEGSGGCEVTGAPNGAIARGLKPVRQRKPHPAALTAGEKLRILDTLCSERFYDQPPAQVFNTLLDERVYLCSVRQMYRLLEDHGLSNERRRGGHARAGLHPEPVVRATRPNQAWSWDITKLKGPESGVLYYLYTVIDIYSRYVVGWAVQMSESTALATSLISACVKREGVNRGELTLHADRGSPMTARSTMELLDELGVRRSHSRPRISNDNPYSEAWFKTAKYSPTYPERFGSLVDARAWMAAFVEGYNHHHRHIGIGLHTPADVHFGHAHEVTYTRNQTLAAARAANPERFNTDREPKVLQLPEAAWINRPKNNDETEENDSITKTVETEEQPAA